MFKIKECIEKKAIKNGLLVKEVERKLSETLWPESPKRLRTDNLRNLKYKSKTLSQDAMIIICRELECTADDICGL